MNPLSDLIKKLSDEAKKLNETFQTLQISSMNHQNQVGEEEVEPNQKKKKEMDNFSKVLSSK